MIDNDITVVACNLVPQCLRASPFPGLRVSVTAGEPPVAGDALHYAKDLRYFNAYGPTETCVCATYMKEVLPFEALPIGVGNPIPNVTLSIRNAEGADYPPGSPGERIGGSKPCPWLPQQTGNDGTALVRRTPQRATRVLLRLGRSGLVVCRFCCWATWQSGKDPRQPCELAEVACLLRKLRASARLRRAGGFQAANGQAKPVTLLYFFTAGIHVK